MRHYITAMELCDLLERFTPDQGSCSRTTAPVELRWPDQASSSRRQASWTMRSGRANGRVQSLSIWIDTEAIRADSM